jgi:sugar phosphate isomerase/epimerase
LKIAISRRTKTYEEARSLFQAAHAAGFAGVQAKPHQYDLAELKPKRFQSIFGDYAQMIGAGLIVYPSTEPEAWLKAIEPILHFASHIGAEEICIVSGVSRSDTSARRVRSIGKILHEIGSIAGTYGTHISLHNHAGCLFESAEDLDRVTEHLDPSVCGITFDTAHAAKGGMVDLGGNIKRLASHITNVHLKDLASEGHFCPLGQGTLDLTGALNALEAIHYNGWLVVDEETKGLSAEHACSISMEFLRAHGVLPGTEQGAA